MDKQLEWEAEYFSDAYEAKGIAKQCYIAGATSSSTVKNLEREVERLKGERKDLIRQLREFIQLHETGLLPHRFTYEDAKELLNSIGE